MYIIFSPFSHHTDQIYPTKLFPFLPQVNPGSKAAQKGIREGDIITSINDQPSMKLNPTEAQKLLKQAGANLKLGLNE